jgi:L-fuconolactonase
MIGSDWPVCTLAGSFREVTAIVEKYLSARPDEDREKVLGATAAAFYGLEKYR